MKNILNLIKIYSKQTFANYTNFFSKKKPTVRKKIAGIAVIVLILAYLMFTIGLSFFQQIEPLRMVGMEDYILIIGFLFSSFLLLFIITYEIQGHFFKAKDFDLVTSLPIKSYEIVISKFSTILLFSYIYQSLIFIPTIITWLVHCNITAGAVAFLIIGFFFLPFFTLILSSIIAFLINFITSKVRRANIVNLIFLFVFFIALTVVYYLISTELVNIFISLGSIPHLIYILFPTSVFLFNAVLHTSILWFLLFLLVSVGSVVLTLFVLSLFYKKINQELMNNKTVYKVKKIDYRPKSIVRSLLNLEIKNYFNITVYVFNTLFGALFLFLASIAGVVAFFEFPEIFASICPDSQSLYIILVIAFSLACGLSITTSSAISLESKAIYIKKSLPIDYSKIIFSKILLNIVVVAPFLFAGFLIMLPVLIAVKLNIFAILSVLVVPLITLITLSTISLMVNLWYPKLNFTTETEVVKQSVSVLISTFLGMIIIGVMVLLYMFLFSTLSIYLYVTIYSALMIFVGIIFAYLLKQKGKILFSELN